MILIGLGANLPSPVHGPPHATLEAALSALEGHGARLARRSGWYRSPALPPSGQPDFVNGVAVLETDLAPEPLMALLLEVERGLGRTRRVRWEARVVDIDLLAYDDIVLGPSDDWGDLVLPHPLMHERAFVLLPLAEVAPDWRHPVLGKSVAELIAGIPDAGVVRPLDEAVGVGPA